MSLPRVHEGAPDWSDGDQAAILDEEPHRGAPTRLTESLDHLLEDFLQNVQIAGVEVGEDIGAHDVPGEVAGEGDGGVAGPADPALRCVRCHKVFIIHARWYVRRCQWCGRDKKAQPVEADGQSEGNILRFSFLHWESHFQPVIPSDSTEKATAGLQHLKRMYDQMLQGVPKKIVHSDFFTSWHDNELLQQQGTTSQPILELKKPEHKYHNPCKYKYNCIYNQKYKKIYKRTDNEGCESQIVFPRTCTSANFGCFEALMIFRKGF